MKLILLAYLPCNSFMQQAYGFNALIIIYIRHSRYSRRIKSVARIRIEARNRNFLRNSYASFNQSVCKTYGHAAVSADYRLRLFYFTETNSFRKLLGRFFPEIPVKFPISFSRYTVPSHCVPIALKPIFRLMTALISGKAIYLFQRMNFNHMRYEPAENFTVVPYPEFTAVILIHFNIRQS